LFQTLYIKKLNNLCSFTISRFLQEDSQVIS